MKSFSFFFLVLFLPFAAAPAFIVRARAATMERDLGRGLSYLRATDLVSDLPAIEATLSTRRALVLDLRQLEADEDTARILRGRLSLPAASARTVRLILISGRTSATVLAQLQEDLPGVLTLAAAIPALTPDIGVSIGSSEDRVAYDALATGTPLEKLLDTETPQKLRYDEASLVRDHANGISRALPSDFEPGEVAADGEATSYSDAAAKPPAPIIDRVLLRAVQLHRTLIALRKL